MQNIAIFCTSFIHEGWTVSRIADTYSFNYLKSQQQAADVLYSEPTLQGNATVSFRKDGPETAVNLELLFNAVTLGKVRN